MELKMKVLDSMNTGLQATSQAINIQGSEQGSATNTIVNHLGEAWSKASEILMSMTPHGMYMSSSSCSLTIHLSQFINTT